MATIILQPNESFEHIHSRESQTIHMKGEVEISFNGTSRIMRDNESVIVPANVPHTITNLGTCDAEVGCIGPANNHGNH
jgi:mannose-6-phosphate isomerase-like protein (cupin superfamily)